MHSISLHLAPSFHPKPPPSSQKWLYNRPATDKAMSAHHHARGFQPQPGRTADPAPTRAHVHTRGRQTALRDTLRPSRKAQSAPHSRRGGAQPGPWRVWVGGARRLAPFRGGARARPGPGECFPWDVPAAGEWGAPRGPGLALLLFYLPEALS